MRISDWSSDVCSSDLASHAAYGSALTVRAAEWFIAFSMVVLSLLKLQNVGSFATMFLNYDLLARRWPPYSYVYPFAEGLAGVLMVAGALNWIRSEEHTSELQSLMRLSYAVFCLKKKNILNNKI